MHRHGEEPMTGFDTATRKIEHNYLILQRIVERGIPERNMWQFSWGGRSRFNPVWEMVLEGSTGFSGAYGRQITLNQNTAKNELTTDLLNSLEDSAKESAIILEIDGVFINGQNSSPVKLQYTQSEGRYNYNEIGGLNRNLTRDELISLALRGEFIGTFTGKHGPNADYDNPSTGTLDSRPYSCSKRKTSISNSSQRFCYDHQRSTC